MPPPELWVPAAALAQLGDRPRDLRSFDVCVAPSGPKWTGWSGILSRTPRRQRPFLGVWVKTPNADRMRLLLGGAVTRFPSHGYGDSGQRRDVSGTSWALLHRIDRELMNDYFNDRE